MVGWGGGEKQEAPHECGKSVRPRMRQQRQWPPKKAKKANFADEAGKINELGKCPQILLNQANAHELGTFASNICRALWPLRFMHIKKERFRV